MRYGLKNCDIEKINSVFAKYPQVEKAILYGSRAKGSFRNGSDIDLTLTGDSLDLDTLLKIETELDDLLLPYKIDLSIKQKIENHDLLEHIERVGKVFYEKEQLSDSDNGLSEWKEVKLSNLLKFGNGKKRPDSNGNIPIYGGNGILGYCGKSNYDDETIIIGRVGAYCGSIYYENKPIWISDNALAAKPKENYDAKFLYYFLKEIDLNQHAGGSSHPLITQTLLNSLEFEVCINPTEQRAIASVLSSLDDKIDLLHRQNKTLEAMAETLFRQWFVEEAKEDWEVGVIPDEFDFLMGQSPKGSSFNENGIGIPMYQGNADFGFRFPNRRIYTTEAKRLAQKYDTLISVRAPVGEQNMAIEECCIGRGVARFRYKSKPEFYTYTYFKFKYLMNEIKQFNNEGTVFGSISKGDFEKFEISIPPFSLVELFQNDVKPIDDKVITNSIQIRTLEKLRDTLLPKLMSGEVQVKFKEEKQ